MVEPRKPVDPRRTAVIAVHPATSVTSRTIRDRDVHVFQNVSLRTGIL